MHGHGELFSEFVAALPKTFKTVTLQYPDALVRSYEELADLLAAACPMGSYVLVAESFSSVLALSHAAQNPANLRGLVLVAGFAKSPLTGWRRCLALVVAPILFRLPLPDSVLKRWLVGDDAPNSILDATRTSIAIVEPKVMTARLRNVLRCDILRLVIQIQVPMLYISARRDRLVRASCLKELINVKPQMHIVSLDGPHMILQRQPLEAAIAVTRFVEKLEPRYGDRSGADGELR